MRVLLTGATGFLGDRILAFCPGNVTLRVIARTGSLDRLPPGDYERVVGDLRDPKALEAALSGIDALINVASLGLVPVGGIIAACRRAGVHRAVFLSSTSIFSEAGDSNQAARRDAEAEIQAGGGLDYTILRPTMIYGTPRDRNIWRLIRYIRRVPIVPLVEGGRRLQQPVFVDDVAHASWAALQARQSFGQAYNLPGAAALSMAQMVATIAERLGRRCLVVPIPFQAAILAASFARRIPGLPRVRREQVMRLREDKQFDFAPATRDLGFRPADFKTGIEREIKWLSN